jgi:hypothetical protein
VQDLRKQLSRIVGGGNHLRTILKDPLGPRIPGAQGGTAKLVRRETILFLSTENLYRQKVAAAALRISGHRRGRGLESAYYIQPFSHRHPGEVKSKMANAKNVTRLKIWGWHTCSGIWS